MLSLAPIAAAARRPEDTLALDAAQEQGALYTALAEQNDLQLVDNSGAFSDVNDPLVREVIRVYFARYHTLVNGLFMANPAPDPVADPVPDPKGLGDP